MFNTKVWTSMEKTRFKNDLIGRDQNRLVPDQNRENIQILGPDQDHELFPNLWTSPGGLLIPAYQG